MVWEDVDAESWDVVNMTERVVRGWTDRARDQ